jgi:hypothetical protein
LQLIQGTSFLLDRAIFPLYNIVTKSVHLPDILGTLLVIYVSLQNTLSSFYDYMIAPIEWNNSLGKFNRYLMYVVLQWDAQMIEKTNETPPFFYFYLAAVSTIFFIFAFLSYFYTIKRYFPIPVLYI